MLIKDIKNDAQSMNVDPSLFYVSGSRDTIIKDKKVLDLVVDSPCLEACKYLFDCNILTQNSSANQNDLSVGTGYITIDYKSLDEHNRKVYEDLVQRKLATNYNNVYFNGDKQTDIVVAQPFMIEVPLNENTDSEEFSKLMLEIAKEFVPQDILYGFYTTKEMEMMAKKSLDMYTDSGRTFEEYLFSKYDGEMSISSLIKEYAMINNYYYDEKNKRYWISEDLYNKSINNVKENIL
jgi:hypothetical protein